MEKSDVYSTISTVHFDHPQRGTLAKLALDQIYSGIGELAKLGHTVVLSFTELPAPIEWPKWQYRDDAPVGRLFEDPIELAEAGDGWRNTPNVPSEPEPEIEPEPEVIPPTVMVSTPVTLESPVEVPIEVSSEVPVDVPSGEAPV